MNARRNFLFALSALALLPRWAAAQQAKVLRIGWLSNDRPANSPFYDAFRGGMRDLGYVEGRNVAIEYRWAEGQYDRLPQLAADLVGRKVSALAATGGIPSVLAAKAATSTIPVVFVMGSDPVKAGVVASLSRPGGNVTGVSFLVNTLGPKRVKLLGQLVPKAQRSECS